MKAIVFDRYGSPDVLEVREIDKPVANDDQVLVRVRASSVNPIDWHRLRGHPYFVRGSEGLRAPKNTGLGADFAGTVEAVGKDVTHVRAGDEVFGMSIRTLADHVAVSGEGVVQKPTNLTFEEAAAVPLAALTALQGLRDKGGIQSGQKVLVNGAAGGVGTFAVQIAKALGAEVTGVCSTRNVDLVRSLGADHVVDYTREDFTRGGRRYDLILDAVANRSLRALERVLTPDGVVAVAGAAHGRSGGKPVLLVARAVLTKRFRSHTIAPYMTQRSRDDLLFLKELIEAGKVKPVIDRSYPLADVPEAIRYLEQGHAQGKVVITV